MVYCCRKAGISEEEIAKNVSELAGELEKKDEFEVS